MCLDVLRKLVRVACFGAGECGLDLGTNLSRNLGFHLLRQLGRWVPVTAHVLQLDPQRGGAALQKHQRAKLRLIRAVPRNHCPSSCLRHHLSRRRRSRRSRRSTCA